MISERLESQIRELLLRRVSQHQIAERLGCSRKATARVLRQLLEPRSRSHARIVPYYLCPDCQKRVCYRPCVVCAATARLHATKKRLESTPADSIPRERQLVGEW
jgi:hypothetical protein